MSDEVSFTHEVECVECKHLFEMKFITSDGKVVDSINPTTYPKCGGVAFHSKFQTDPNAWFGVMGSNG